MNCQSNIASSNDLKLTESNCLEPRPVCSGGDLTRFDSYQPVSFVNYINPSSGTEHEVPRKFQGVADYDRRGCGGGNDSDQQLSVISEYIEEEEGFIDDDNDDVIVNGECKDHNNKVACERAGGDVANPKREKINGFQNDVELDTSSENSSKADSEGSKLLIIS